MSNPTADSMMQPCRRGCGELVHLENDGFHVCRNPTHRCTICGALWIFWPAGIAGSAEASWSLFSKKCGPCCDNAAMGDQIEPLHVYAARCREVLRQCAVCWPVGSITRKLIDEQIKPNDR